VFAVVAPALAAAPETPQLELSSRSATQASLRGVLSPGAPGEAGVYELLYRKSATECRGESQSAQGLALEVQGQEVLETLTGLESGAQYTVCLRVESSATHEEALSAPVTFTLPPQAPEVAVQAPVHATTAAFQGVLDPLGPSRPGTYEFLYRKSKTECKGESRAPASPAISVGAAHEEVLETVTGLKANTEYTVCLLARNGTAGEEAVGPAVTFTTALPPETPEKVELAQATATSLTLEGVLNPKAAGNAGSYEFLYKAIAGGAGCKGEGSVRGTAAGARAETAQAEASGLQPHAQYAVCLLAHNEAGEASAPSPSKIFETLPAPPVIAGETASEVKSSEATLQAQINPDNEETNYTFEYSTKETAGKLEGTIVKVPGAAALSGYPEKPAAVTLSALNAGETYYYRVVAENAQSRKEPTPAEAPVQSFTTVPTPSTVEVSSITATFAQFRGHLAPLNPEQTTDYQFDYKLGSAGCAGESSTPAREAGTGPGTEVTASEGAGALQPDAEYTVCLVTRNASGSDEGPPVHFETLPAPLSVVGQSVSGVTASEATLEAQINPNNEKTSYAFEYATNEAMTDATTVGAGTLEGYGAQAVSTQLSGLQSGEAYYYRIVAENETSTAEGRPVTGAVSHFAALGAPRVTTTEAQSVTSSSAELAGAISPAGLLTTYHFIYVPAGAYEPGSPEPYARGMSTPEGAVNPGGPLQSSVYASAEELRPGETYDYTIVASNEQGGPVTGPNETFTTSPLATPAPPVAPPGEETTPPAPTPPASLPLLSYESIAQLDAREAQEDKGIPSPRASGPLTKAQKLSKALRACHAKKGKKRSACEAAARKKYGPARKRKR
jgi:hypothetical protein